MLSANEASARPQKFIWQSVKRTGEAASKFLSELPTQPSAADIYKNKSAFFELNLYSSEEKP